MLPSLPYYAPIKNNRKRTRGRQVQVIQESATVKRKVKGQLVDYPNPRIKNTKDRRGRQSVKVIHAPNLF
jgi:hypothetical protein